MPVFESPAESAAAAVRRHFHWCLAAVILPVITLPLEWAAAFSHRRPRATLEHRRWSRWLFALVVVDTIIAGLVIALVASGAWGLQTLTQRRSPAAGGERVRLGALIAANPQRPHEAQITSVAHDSPAERAGLEVGDVLIAIDGVPIRDVGDAIGRIRDGEPGVPRTLHIRRDGQDAQIVVTPELRTAIHEPTPRAAAPAVPCIADFQLYVHTMLRWRGLWAAPALMILLWRLSRRVQGPAPALWSWVAAAFSIEVVVGMLAFSAVCVSLGGPSPEVTLITQLIHSLALLVVGVIAMQRMERAGLLGARIEPLLGTGRAVLLGFFYLAVVNIRLSILASALEAFAHVRVPTPPEDVIVSGLAGLGPLGHLLLALRVVMVVPVAEEVLFRGVILPRLASWMGGAWAVVATSAIFAVLHEGYGYEAIGVRAAAILLVALVLGWARLRTGNITAPITIHMITNALVLWSHR